MLYYDDGNVVDTLSDSTTPVSELELRGMLEHGNVINGVRLQGGMLSYYDWRKANLLKSSVLISGLGISNDGRLREITESYPYDIIDLNMYGEPDSSFYIKKGGLVIMPIKSALLQFDIYASTDCMYVIDLSGLSYLYAMPYVNAVARGRALVNIEDIIQICRRLRTSYSGVANDLCCIYGVITGMAGSLDILLKRSIESSYCFTHTYLSDLYYELIKATDLVSLAKVLHDNFGCATINSSNLPYVSGLLELSHPSISLYFRYLRNAIKAYGYTAEFKDIITNFRKLVKNN